MIHDPRDKPPVSSTGSGLREAIQFLLPLGRSAPSTSDATLARAAFWIVPLGLVIGVLWVGCFRATWRLFGEIANMRIVPPLGVVLLESLLTGSFLILGMARIVHRLTTENPTSAALDRHTSLAPAGTLALVLVVLTQWVLIASIPAPTPWWPEHTDWRSQFSFLYPAPIYRPLLLAPIWGRWGILLAATIGRTEPRADHKTMILCQAMRPARAMKHALLPFILTAVYCSRRGNLLIGIALSLTVFGVTYLASVLMAHRGGGQSRQSLYAAGQVAQLTLLALYRACWPIIHG